MPVNVNIEDIKGPEGERARRLYAVPRGTEGKPHRESFERRSAPARRRMAERKKDHQRAQKNAAQRRSARNQGIRRAVRIGGKAHRAIGSPGAVVAGALALFVGAGIVVAVVRSPALVTVPLRIIAAAIRAFTGLLSVGAPHAAAPTQNVAPRGV